MNHQATACRGVRGATTVSANEREMILAATRDLLGQIVAANDIQAPDVASIFFTLTSDLDAEYPALAARQLGWVDVPLLCSREIDRPGALPHTIRVLLHWNTHVPQRDIQHVYTGGAEVLRPDLANPPIETEEERA